MNINTLHELSKRRTKIKIYLDKIEEEINHIINNHLNYIRPGETLINNRLVNLLEKKEQLEKSIFEIDLLIEANVNENRGKHHNIN